MKKKVIKLIIFDLWKTLAYKDLRNNTVPMMMKKLGIKIPHDKLVKIFESSIQTQKWKSKDDAYVNLCKNVGLEVNIKNINLLKKIRDERERKVKLYKYVIPLLKKLKKQGYKIGLLSNTSIFSIKYVKDKTNLLDYIDYTMFSYEYGGIKPSLKGFKQILKKAKCKPSEAIMIGDKLGDDVIPPRKLGMNAIHLKNYSQLRRDLKNQGISI